MTLQITLIGKSTFSTFLHSEKISNVSVFRIRFDRGGLSTYSIPDEEVQSVEEPEMMPLSSFTARPR